MTFLEVYAIGLGVVLGLMTLLWVVSLFLRNSSTTTVLYKVALLADNGGSTMPLEG